MADEELIDDQYQLVMCVASGSSSQVWEVTEKASGRHLAMKLLKKDSPEFKINKGKMKREAAIQKAMEHPMIAKFEKFSSNRDHTYILMEYFRASNLKLQLKSGLNKVHLKARPLLEGICASLSHVHQKGFVHRDVKPDNILMNRAGEIRLVDFSLSSKEIKGFGRYFAGRLKAIEGTRNYIAPETIRRKQPTVKTDLYSLGVLFFEVLAGKTPFHAVSPEELLQKHLRLEAPNPSEHNPNVAPEMDRLIARLLKKKPADRPGNVDEVLAELKRIRIFKEDVVDEELLRKQQEDANAIETMSELRLDSRADAKLKQMLETNPEFAEKYRVEMESKKKKKKIEQAAAQARINKSMNSNREKEESKPKAAAPKPAAPAAAPPPQPMPQPMPMPMPGYAPGYQPYPQGYAPYPQGPMPMPPGMAPPMPGMPQYPAQPQMGYPQQPMQRPPAPQQAPPQQPTAARPPAAPAAPAGGQRPPAAAPAQQRPPAPAVPGQQRPAAAAPAAKPAAPPVRPAQQPPAPAQPAAPATDMEFMTDLPDVL